MSVARGPAAAVLRGPVDTCPQRRIGPLLCMRSNGAFCAAV
ncbi:hypothetical protein ACSNOH_21215 [Streptomyces sp. URMC 127]